MPYPDDSGSYECGETHQPWYFKTKFFPLLLSPIETGTNILPNGFMIFWATGIGFQKINKDLFEEHSLSNFPLNFEI